MPKRLNDVCEEHHENPELIQKAQAAMVDGLTATRLARMFKALSDPSRVRMALILGAGETSVFDLASSVAMSQSAVSHQLATLRDGGIVKFRKVGRKVYYSLEDEHIARLCEIALSHKRRSKEQ